jgi:hypothetical protein
VKSYKVESANQNSDKVDDDKESEDDDDNFEDQGYRIGDIKTF